MLPPATPQQQLGLSASKNEWIVKQLEGYRVEARQNRLAGMNPRDQKWTDNLNLYWNRYDFSTKAAWQAKETMPEVPAFVDRFAGALKEALVATPEGFYTVVDPYDVEGDLTNAVKRMNDVWLSTCGNNAQGTPLGFDAVFEEQMKLGALTACCGNVTWKEDVDGGRVAFETIDPRFVWLDHTYRNLYRVRTVELDISDVQEMIGMKTPKGMPVFDLDEMQGLVASIAIDQQRWRQEMSGSGDQVTSDRKPIQLDEYRATVTDEMGKVIERDGLFVVANNKFLIRAEKNPFWHGKDWMVFAPLVTTPLSVYGRSYMEDFGSIAQTFTELTNLILDAVHATAIKAYVAVPGMLSNPGQLTEGIHPGMTYMLEDGYSAEQFAKALDLGGLDAGAVQVWQSMKKELSEAAGINEIGMGQLPQTHIAATSVAETQSSSNAGVRSIAQTVEMRFLNVILDLMWKTGLQHVRKGDTRMGAAAGQELFDVLMQERRSLIKHPITFQARGISTLIQRSQMLQKLMQIMQVLAQNENLLAAFMQVVDMDKLLKLIFQLSNIDLTKLQASPREKMIRSVLEPMQAAAAGGTATPNGIQEMGGVAQAMGVAQQ